MVLLPKDCLVRAEEPLAVFEPDTRRVARLLSEVALMRLDCRSDANDLRGVGASDFEVRRTFTIRVDRYIAVMPCAMEGEVSRDIGRMGPVQERGWKTTMPQMSHICRALA